jgi:hypothetical protein
MNRFLMLGLLCAIGASAALAVEVGQQGPNVTFDRTWNVPEGAKQLEDYRGRVVLLEVWATW